MELQGCACLIYMHAWCDMMSERDRAKAEIEKLHVYANFAKKYTILPHYWSKFRNAVNESNRDEFSGWFHFLGSGNNEESKHIEYRQIDAQVLMHCLAHPSLRKLFVDIKKAETCLSFPHGFLDEIYQVYTDSTPRPISKAITMKYQKNKKLYAKIKDYENDIDKWLQCMEEIEDSEAVMANFELQLGKSGNWTIKKIWDAYFKFLKENNLKEILDVYRKYTRLFISDKEAIEEYRNEIEKFSSWNVRTTHFWIDTIKWEIDFGDLKFAYILLQRAVKAVLNKNVKLEMGDRKKLEEYIKFYEREIDEMEAIPARLSLQNCIDRREGEMAKLLAAKKLSIFYTKNNSVKQVFPFRQSFIQHLLKSANGNVLRKLYSTCKFFFSIQSAPLCYRLEIGEYFQNEIWEEVISINNDGVEFSALENLHIYGRLVVKNVGNERLLSTVIPKLYRCDASILEIENQKISVNDYKFLLSQNITEIYLHDVNVCDSIGEGVDGKALLEITKKCQNLKFFEAINDLYFVVCSCFQNNKQSQILWNMSFVENSFQIIHIEGQYLNINEFLYLLGIIDTTSTDVLIVDVLIVDDDGNVMTPESVDDIVKLHYPHRLPK